MPRKKSRDYKAIAATVRKYGFKPKFGTHRKGASGDASKRQLRRMAEKIRLFVPGGSKNKFVFVETDTAQKKEASKGLNPKVRTPTGFFYQVPRGAKKYRIRFKGEHIVVDAVGARGGMRREKIYRLNAASLAANPRAEIERATGKIVGPFLAGRMVVNGHDAHSAHIDLAEFEKYLAEFFLTSQDPNRKGILEGEFNGAAMTPRQFTDIFHIKLIEQAPTPPKKIRHVPKNRKSKKK